MKGLGKQLEDILPVSSLSAKLVKPCPDSSSILNAHDMKMIKVFSVNSQKESKNASYPKRAISSSSAGFRG